MKNKGTNSMIKFPCLLLSLAAGFTALSSCTQKPEDDSAKAAYFVGNQIGKNLKAQNIQLDRGYIMQGISDVLKGTKPLLNDEELKQAQQIFNKLVNAKINETKQANLKSSAEFLEANKKNLGWVTTASGLQYKVLKAGKGKKPNLNDTVVVHYVGTLLDGTKFDSSRDRGKPAEFQVNKVIKGWTEALQLMPQGSHWVIVLPPHLAYGETGNGPIPPQSVLVFDLENLAVK